MRPVVLKMRHFTILILVLALFALLCEGDDKEKKIGKKISKAAMKGATALIAGKTRKSRFFTAWTIISLAMLVVVLIVGAYYLHMFYPLVCAKRGKYDVMEMAHV